MDRRERVLAEQNAKSREERASEAVGLVLGGFGGATGTAAKVKGGTGKTPPVTQKSETPKVEPAKQTPKAETPKPAEKPQEAAAKPAQGSGGGYSVSNGRAEKGKCGEWLAKQDLHNEGYTDVMEVQNKSGHGVDVMGRNANGDVRVLEVKTTDGATAPALSKDQASMGGEGFTKDRVGKAAGGQGHYKNSPDAIANGKKAASWLKEAAAQGKKPSYEKYDVFIEDPKEGCIKKKTQSSSWEKKPQSSPRRRK